MREVPAVFAGVQYAQDGNRLFLYAERLIFYCSLVEY